MLWDMYKTKEKYQSIDLKSFSGINQTSCQLINNDNKASPDVCFGNCQQVLLKHWDLSHFCIIFILKYWILGEFEQQYWHPGNLLL